MPLGILVCWIVRCRRRGRLGILWTQDLVGAGGEGMGVFLSAAVVVDTSTQMMRVNLPNLQANYAISTAKNGTGQLQGSYCTPLGWHCIAQKIGQNAPLGAVFVGRQMTGEIYSEQLYNQYPNRDWILTRILWLKGLQDGYNAGVDCDGRSCDSYERLIYIHGTSPIEPMGMPRSHGCIRMKDDELVVLFDNIDVGALVLIV